MGTMAGQVWVKAAGVGLVLALVGVPASLTAQQKSSEIKADSAFIMEAASGGMMEVQLGKMAEKQAKSSAVKQFGQRMVTDHSKANKKLEALASEGGVTPPAKLSPKHQQNVDQLAGKSGSEFDKTYMGVMVKDHTEDVSKFEEESRSANSTQIRNFAKQTVPILRQHLTLAKRVAKEVGADTSAAAVSTTSSK
jgi:putative membrane protein